MSDREKRLIDANELKDSFGFLRKMWSETEICGIIDAMPTADVTVQKWIPASEPPKVKKIEKSYGVVYRKSENVLCSCIVMGGKRMTKPGYLVYINDNPQPQWQIRGDWYSVTHWMPLPEPPKECE